MGTCLTPTCMQHHRYCCFSRSSAAAASPHFISISSFTSGFDHFYSKFNPIRTSLFRSHYSFPSSQSDPRAWSGRCHARSPGPPPPPPPPPPPKLEPPGEKSDSSSGALSTFSQVQDAVRIFFSVLFWMSLFFWSCVWDGSNNGRPGKGPWFRR